MILINIGRVVGVVEKDSGFSNVLARKELFWFTSSANTGCNVPTLNRPASMPKADMYIYVYVCNKQQRRLYLLIL